MCNQLFTLEDKVDNCGGTKLYRCYKNGKLIFNYKGTKWERRRGRKGEKAVIVPDSQAESNAPLC